MSVSLDFYKFNLPKWVWLPNLGTSAHLWMAGCVCKGLSCSYDWYIKKNHLVWMVDILPKKNALSSQTELWDQTQPWDQAHPFHFLTTTDRISPSFLSVPSALA